MPSITSASCTARLEQVTTQPAFIFKYMLIYANICLWRTGRRKILSVLKSLQRSSLNILCLTSCRGQRPADGNLLLSQEEQCFTAGPLNASSHCLLQFTWRAKRPGKRRQPLLGTECHNMAKQNEFLLYANPSCWYPRKKKQANLIEWICINLFHFEIQDTGLFYSIMLFPLCAANLLMHPLEKKKIVDFPVPYISLFPPVFKMGRNNMIFSWLKKESRNKREAFFFL